MPGFMIGTISGGLDYTCEKEMPFQHGFFHHSFGTISYSATMREIVRRGPLYYTLVLIGHQYSFGLVTDRR